VERCRDRIQQLTRDLVVTSAWLSVARTLDDRKKAALSDWTAALRKIGKGTGKSAAHWQAVAQRAMTEAVDAVPVWVMSIDRALEQFQGGRPLFDVVIVDEASQADVFALPVLSLAERAVVVGDDQQIGPQIVGVPTDRVQALIDAHLSDVPSAVQFDTESSLYDHAVRRSPERILLTEHFRCVPAIISFSSDHYYDRKIQPLRADLPTGIGAPVHAVFVPGGLREERGDFGEVNVPEAEALVSRVALIVADPAYDGKTLGVISLLSTSGQAAYLHHRLREEIGPEELERRQLRVGDAYTFQGDERDVVLISMVVAGQRVGAGAAFGAFTKRDFHRRVNVAASRARDQLWLFHSVQLGDLTADDARALLLAYCQRPRAADAVPVDPETACTNDFERAVLRRLRERGLHPLAQFRLGAFRIDFVLPAPDGRRLAIECDGERYHGADAFAADLRRQAILERVGNATFVRLRSSVFHRDPDVALAPVWQRVEELGIPTAAVP
jgi:very-short-patch-repair endonuclease